MKTLRSISLAAALAATLAAPAAFAGAVHDAGLFTTVLARNDDGSTGSVGIGFSIHFYGLSSQSTLFVNNNGNVTFTGPLSTFTPFGLLTSTIPIIAPFFADVDTRNLGSDVVRYGTGSIGGRSVFGVNWIDVGYESVSPPSAMGPGSYVPANPVVAAAPRLPMTLTFGMPAAFNFFHTSWV